MLVYLLLISTGITAQQVLVGKVVKVVDGDTFDLLSKSNKIYRIRMLEIDTPERGQVFYRVSKQALAAQIFSKEIKVLWTGTDRNGRLLGTVLCQGRNINLYMVEAGYAWHFKRYSKDIQFAKAELQARAAKRGLWGQGQAIAPWEFRKSRR
mgnify:CR=1 FL=1